jgi:hypothetical protein
MTLEEAINVLEQYSHEPEGISLEDETHAIELGIEALKAVKECRASHMFCPGMTMPGESEEEPAQSPRSGGACPRLKE